MTGTELSQLLVWSAATALTIGLIMFAVDLARLADVPRRAPARVPLTTEGDGRADGADGVDGVDGGPHAPQNRRFAAMGMSVTVLGTVLLLVAIVARGIAAGRAPWANMYEFTIVGAFITLATFVLVARRAEVRFLGSFVVGLCVLFLALAQVVFVPATATQPALQSYWLVLHVGVAIIATGIFTVSFVVSVLQLLRDSRENGAVALSGRSWRWLDGMPVPAQLEILSFRLNAVAFVLWTFTLIGGAIWAEHAWGRYWGWDPKEVWSFVVWVVYAAYLHARTTRGWSGRRAAYLVLVGYACVLFNFTGVNLIFNGKHSYSGIS